MKQAAASTRKGEYQRSANEQGDRARVAGNPIKFRGVDEAPHHYPPPLGADTRAELCEVLGLSETEYETYRKDGIVREQS